VQADELVAQLEAMSDEEWSLVVDDLSESVMRIRRRQARSEALALAARAAAEAAGDAPLEAAGSRRWLGRDRQAV